MNNKKIAIFYHVYQYGNWIDLVTEQLDLLKSSGLYDASSLIHIGINGNDPFPFEGEKFKITRNPSPEREEAPTLESLLQFCNQNDDWNILYFHTKSVTRLTPETTDWRKVMEYFCIERWKDCLEKLKINDTVGCLYMAHHSFGSLPCYSGNFWWSKSDYIRTLNHNFLIEGVRQYREFWIGTGKGSMFSFFDTGADHYNVRLPRERYSNILDN